MMAKMGWQEGQGLGKDAQGRATYVQVKKKDDNAGLGKEKAQQNNVNDQWYFDAFDSALANMGGKKKKKKDKKSKKKSGSSDKSSDGDDSMYDKMFKATGGARMGMRARASQNGKLARTEGGHDGTGDDEPKDGTGSRTGAAGEALEGSTSRKRRRAAAGADVVKKEETLGAEVKREENTSGDKKVTGVGEEGGGEGGVEVEATSKAERRRQRSEAKKAKRANKAVKEEGADECAANSGSETQASVPARGEGEEEGEGKARKKKKKKRAAKET
ncbi:unnamed protein product [Laminaria digitata]